MFVLNIHKYTIIIHKACRDFDFISSVWTGERRICKPGERVLVSSVLCCSYTCRLSEVADYSFVGWLWCGKLPASKAEGP